MKFSVSIEVPKGANGLQLQFNRNRVRDAAGRAIAKVVKRSIKAGTTPSGKKLMKTWFQKGELVSKIGARKGRVKARGAISRSRLNATALAGVLVYGKTNWKVRGDARADRSPFESDAPRVVEAAEAAADKEFAKQARNGQLQITRKAVRWL